MSPHQQKMTRIGVIIAAIFFAGFAMGRSTSDITIKSSWVGRTFGLSGPSNDFEREMERERARMEEEMKKQDEEMRAQMEEQRKLDEERERAMEQERLEKEKKKK